MTKRLHLLPWDKPLLPQVVARLTADWNGTGPLDLSDRLVIVPTRQAGRRLREALAAHAAARGQAVFPPRVLPPESLVTLGAPTRGIASRLAGQLAWIEVFRDISLDDFRAVFPVDPPVRDFGWARRLAGQFMSLQSALAESGLRLATVVARAGEDCPERLRWQQLGELETHYDQLLAQRGLRDAQAAKIDWAHEPALPSGIKQIVVLAVPDPLPLALEVLTVYARTLPVEIVVCGPADEELQALFDEWGRPQAEAWSQRAALSGPIEPIVRLAADPGAQAELIFEAARGYAEPEAVLAVGVADPEVLAPLEDSLRRAGVTVFNPEGKTRRRDGLFALLSDLADLAADERFDVVANLLHCPEVLAWLERRLGQKFSPATLLGQLDELHAKHLPPTLAAARAAAAGFPLVAALAQLQELRAQLTQGEFPDNALAALARIFDGCRVSADDAMAESATAWMDLLAEFREAGEFFPGLNRAEGWELALALFAESARFGEKPAGALELQGWLELLWEDAPHLIVAGLNEGCVPKAIAGDAFLPEALRQRLGLKTNPVRFACDNYLLAVCAAMRAKQGRIDLLVGKVSLAGDPLRPSRLLLRCADEELPSRIEFLFRKVEAAQASYPWTRAWPLTPRRVSPPEKISVTALRTYLECPFRFYLKQVLKMESVDPTKAELDAFDFGTLLHNALEIWGKEEGLRACADEGVLRDAVLTEFEKQIRRIYGAELTLPLVIQFESARQRLRKAAEVQAQIAAEGWVIERTESKIECEIGGLRVRGKIDRIDRHPDGRVRVIDYKTSDKPVNPAAAHLESSGSAQPPPEPWACVAVNGKEQHWVDLQLPLYRYALAEEFGVAVECGYFNLPKAAGETAVSLWADYTADLQASAEACATEVARRVGAGKFWPPVELPERLDGDWAMLLQHGAAASIAANWADGGGQ